MRNERRNSGFTLIELMITVAVVGILMAVAYPSYTEHIKRGKRSAAQSFMVTLSNKEEQQLLNTRCYFNYQTDTSCPPPSITVPAEVQANYTVTITASMSTPPAYTITAAPTTAMNDPKCGTLTYTNTAAKGASGTLGASGCWR